MGQRGPTPTPSAVLRLRGSWRGDANPDEPTPERGVPECPAYIEGVARSCWEQVAPMLDEMGVLTKADGVALALLCTTFARWRLAEELLDEHGQVHPILDNNGDVKYLQQTPYVSIARNNAHALKGMLEQFGLTPSARSRIRVEPVKRAPTEDARTKYLTGGGA